MDNYNDDEDNLLMEIEDAVYERLTEIGFLVKDMPQLVAYLMAFSAKLHISMDGNEKAFLKLGKSVYKNLLPQKDELIEDFTDFLNKNSENIPESEHKIGEKKTLN